MSYEAVMEQIRSVPEEYLDEVSGMIGYILYRHGQQSAKPASPKGTLSDFLGKLNIERDPLEIQKEMRREWN